MLQAGHRVVELSKVKIILFIESFLICNAMHELLCYSVLNLLYFSFILSYIKNNYYVPNTQ